MERYTLNYQLFKRNNMKKYLSLAMIGLSLMLSGCSKDDNNDPDTPPTGDIGKVRYEATVSDPENFKLLKLQASNTLYSRSRYFFRSSRRSCQRNYCRKSIYI